MDNDIAFLEVNLLTLDGQAQLRDLVHHGWMIQHVENITRSDGKRDWSTHFTILTKVLKND